MENSKLIPLLQSLDKEEFKSFGRFVKSKVYNPNKNLIKLYEELKKYYPSFKPKNVEQEKVYSRIFPGKPFHIGIMRNLISDMMQLVKDFFVYMEFTKDSFRQKKYLLSELNRKDLYKFFEKEYLLAGNEYKRKKILDEKLELDMYNIYGVRADYLKKNLPESEAGQYYNVLSSRMDNLANFIIVTALKDYFKLMGGKSKANFKENLILKDELISHIDSNSSKYFKIPVIDILYHFIKLREKESDDKLFKTVKKKIYDAEGKLSKTDLREFFIELGDFCSRQASMGRNNFVEELFELEKEMLASGIYYEEDGKLSAASYNKIATAAFNAKNFDWAEKFLFDYKDKLRRPEKINAYNFNLGAKFYAQGALTKDNAERNYAYENALNLFSMVKIDNYDLETKIKGLQIRIYFEMDEMSRTTFLADTLKHYLKRNKTMPKDIKERYRNFADYVLMLIKLKAGSETVNLKDYKKSLNDENNVENKDWLVKQGEKFSK